MQLKTIGESLTALNVIQGIVNNTTNSASKNFVLLKGALEGYSVESVKAAISQTTFTDAQIKTILSSKGLKGEILETTAAELAQVTSTNALSASQKAATSTTIGFSNAMKGLGVSVKNLVLAHPVLLTIASTLAAVYTTYKGVEFAQKWADGTIAIKNYNKELEKSEQIIEDNKSTLSEYQSEIDSNNSKIKELQELYDNDTITDAQKAELENLKYQNALLDQKIEKLEQVNKDELKNQAITAEKKFNTQFNEGVDDTQSTNAKDVISRVSKDLGGNGTYEGVSWNRAVDGIENNTAVQQLARLKLATDAYNQAVSDFNNGVNDVTKDDVENAKLNLDIITQSFENNRESLYNSLISDMEKMKAVEGTEAYNQYAYESMQSWLEIFQQYIPEYKKAMEKVQQEADANPIKQPVEYSSDFESLNKSLQTLTDNASLLSSINKEISETGRISADNLAKINEAFPENKYPELTKALYEYQLGLISTTELFEELEKCYNQDAENYKKEVLKKLETDENFTKELAKNYPELFEQLNNIVYAGDLENWKSLEQTKLDIDNQITELLKKNWASYIGMVYDAASGMYDIAYRSGYSSTASSFNSADDSDLAGQFATEDEYQEYLNRIRPQIEQVKNELNSLKNLKDSIENTALDSIDLNLGDLGWDSLSGDLDSAKDSAKDTSQEMNWLERAIKKVQNAYSRLKNVVSDTTRSWSTRNNALIQSQQELTRQINLQSQAYEYYMQLFNALDLDDYYKKLIMDGAMFVETITDPDLLELINKAIELFDKAEEAKNNVSSMTAELHELSTQLFDNTAKEFQGKISVYEHAMKTLENGVSLIETKGYKVTASLYEEMIDETQDRIDLLQQERSALESAMASADVEVGSEAWMDMYNQILDVDNAIQDATISLAEFNNELRQLKWDKFDDIQLGIQETIDEADFLYKLLENKGLTEETGGLNDNGVAAQGLLAEKYNLYMAMADKYAKEVKAIDAELANDPGNVKLLERRQELLQAQRDAILNAEDEKESIKDLIEDSYNKLGDTLSDLISKYKDFMKTIKDTYDYEKQMSEKTKELADLQKQFNAVKGDNSEEGMSRQQQLEEQIKTKQEDIQQTEYEKLISDTEALLDKFNSEYQEWLTNLVTELETTLQMAIDQTNQYSDQILSTLNDQAYNVGYTLSDATTSVFSSIGDSVAMYGQGFLDSANGINSSIMLVENAVEAVYNAVQAQAIAQQAIAQAQSQIAGAMMGGGSSGSQSASGEALSGQNSTGSGGGNSIGVGSIMTLKDGSSYWETSWGNGRSGSKYAGVQGGVIIDEMSIAGLVEGGENDPNAYGDHYVHIRSADGVYRDLGWVRWEDLEEYGTGTRHAKDDLAWTQDGGSEIIRTSDGAVLTPIGKGGMVFDNASSERLYEFAQDPAKYLDKLNLSSLKLMDIDKYIPNVNSPRGDVNMGGVNFNIGQIIADNPQEFASQLKQVMASDKNTQRMIQEITLGQSLGNNSFNTRRYL